MVGHIEERTFFSAALGRTMRYSLYLPPDYADPDSAERYPVLYLLHGRGDSHQSWTDYGLATQADRLIGAGVIPPLLIAMPEGESGYWADHVSDGPRWGTYVSRDLVAEIDSSLRTIPTRSGRAIGGISMGGHGALQLAVRHPATFSVVGAHSVALRTREIAPAFLGAGADFEARDPTTLYSQRSQAAHSLQIWIDIGADDPWLPAATRFHSQLMDQDITHEWIVQPGGHDPGYWRAHLADYLTFYGRALRDAVPASAGAAQSSLPPV